MITIFESGTRHAATDESGEEDTPFDYPSRAVVPAAECQPPATRAPSSVFAMAQAAKASQALRKHGRFGAAEGFEPLQVERTSGVTKCVGARYPANRWDERRVEQDRQRRAKQKPPKPSRKAKTRGKKLLALVGDDDGR